MRRFEGQVAALTGAGSGIGAATARRLSAEGAHVWLLDRDVEAARAVASRLPSADALEVDVADPHGCDDAVVRILDTHGRLEVMVVDRDSALAEEAAASAPGTVWSVAADVGDEQSVAAAIEAVLAERGQLDIVVNNAGIAGPQEPAGTTDLAGWDATCAPI